MSTAYDNLTKEELISTVIVLKSELDQIKRLIYGSKSERFVSPATDNNQVVLDLETDPPVATPAETLQTII